MQPDLHPYGYLANCPLISLRNVSHGIEFNQAHGPFYLNRVFGGMDLIRFRRGKVASIIERNPGLTELVVIIGDTNEKAINYEYLTGEVKVGDVVLLNTTAQYKNLGTGGYHYVVAVEGKNSTDPGDQGHIMKLRYTPFQVKVLAVEEENHPGNHLYRSVNGLGGIPVAVGTLHSMIATAAVALKHTAGPGIKLAYLMTDGAALPIWLSRLVRNLKAKNLIDFTITCGHAFGGDYEAINIYSGLLWAKAAGADAVLVSMGPGIVGSSSEFGHTGLEQGEIINAINVLGGHAIAIPRISFADARKRHFGLSHHTRTALGKVALSSCIVPIPACEGKKKSIIYGQLKESGIYGKHTVVEVNTRNLPAIIKLYGIEVATMGRSISDDPEFFHTSWAAGIYAAGLLQTEVDKIPDRNKKVCLATQSGDQF